MTRKAPCAAALAVLFLVSPPVRAPTMNPGRSFDVDPLLGPWPVEQHLLPCDGLGGVAGGHVPRNGLGEASPAAELLRPVVDRLNQAWASLRSSLDRAAPSLRAGLAALNDLALRAASTATAPAAVQAPPETDADAAFMRRYFDDLFRPQAAAAGFSAPAGAINLADVFVKLTAIAFVGAIVLVPAGCAGASAALYGQTE